MIKTSSSLPIASVENTAKFRAALKNGDPHLAVTLLHGPIDLDDQDESKASLLMVAAYRGYSNICLRLLELGADPLYGFEEYYPTDNGTDETEWHSPLTRAKMSRDLPTIDVVERAFVGAQWRELKKIKDNDPSGFLHFGTARLDDAARLGMMDLCLEMVTQGIPVESSDVFDSSPATYAADSSQLPTCLLLLALGASPEPLQFCASIPEDLLSAFLTVAKHLKTRGPAENEASPGLAHL